MTTRPRLVFVVLITALGQAASAAGAGVDALHTGRTTIYQRAGAVAEAPRPRRVALLRRIGL